MTQQTLKQSAQKVQTQIDQLGWDLKVKTYPSSTRSARDAAKSIGCEVAQIGKSIVFHDQLSDSPVLVIASGVNQIDTKLLDTNYGLSLISVDAKYVKKKTGFTIGGIPPLGHQTTLKTFLDSDLKNMTEIWVAAGTPNTVFSMTPDHLSSLGDWVDVIPR